MLIELIRLLDFCLFLFYKICHHESPSVPQIWVLGMSHHQLPLEGMITSSWFLCRPRRSAEPHWGVESSHRHSWCLQTALSNRPEAVSERQVIYYLTEGKDPKSITSYSPEPGRFWFRVNSPFSNITQSSCGMGQLTPLTCWQFHALIPCTWCSKVAASTFMHTITREPVRLLNEKDLLQQDQDTPKTIHVETEGLAKDNTLRRLLKEIRHMHEGGGDPP